MPVGRRTIGQKERAIDAKASIPIRILIVEDSADDAELLLDELHRCGYDAAWERVETAGAMRAALKDKPWDIIFSDFLLPGFGGMGALQIAQQSGLDLPFIVISGKVGEEKLVEMMKAGATDILVKGHLERLGSVVRRELVDSTARSGLRRARIEWRAAFDAVADPIFFHDAEFRVVRANLAYAALAGMSVQEVIGRFYWEPFAGLDGPLPGCRTQESPRAGYREEFALLDGTVYQSRSFPIRDRVGRYLYSMHVLQDVTERNRVKDAVETGERRFRSLVEHASDLLAVVDVQGVITYISPSIRRMGGYEESEVLGRGFLEFAHPEDVLLAREGLASVLRVPDDMHTTEFRFRHKDGSWVMLQSIARNALSDPAVRGIVINSRNVTESKNAEQASQAYLRRTRAQAEAIAAIGSSEALLNGEVEKLAAEITELATKVAGVERANVWLFNEDETELHCIDLYEATPARHSEGMLLKESEYRSEFRALKTSPYVNADDPLTDPRTKGYVETYVKPLRITSMLDALVEVSGRHLGLVCLEHVDIAHHWEEDEIAFASQLADKISLGLTNQARHRSQQALERNERYFRKLIEGGSDAYFVIDRAGTIIYRSPTGLTLTGWSDEEVTGTGVTNYVMPEQVHLAQAAIAQTIRNPAEVIRLDLRLLRKDGGEIEADISARNLLADPDVGGIVVTIRDITERKQTELDLQRRTTFFEALVRGSLDGLLVVDANGRKVLQNQRMIDLWKIPKDFAENPDDADQLRFVAGLVTDSKAFVDKVIYLNAHPKETSRDEISIKDGAVFDRYSAPVTDVEGRSFGRIWSFRDVTERKRAEAELVRLNWAMRALGQASSAMMHAATEQELYANCCEAIADSDAYPLAWIGLPRDDPERRVEPVAVAGSAAAYVEGLSVSWADTPNGMGPAGKAIRMGLTQIIGDLVAAEAFAPWLDRARAHGLACTITLPIRCDGAVAGALIVYGRVTNAFGAPEIRLFEELAGDIGYGLSTRRTRIAYEAGIIEQARAAERLRATFESAIGALAVTVEQRDPYTAGHQRRVAQLAVAIARDLGFDEERLTGLRVAGMIHDIGKISVPAEILARPGRIGPIEFALIKTHAQTGYDIVKGVNFPWPVADAIRQHHERMDGSGYPQGLKGGEIILEARILAVADVVEAMSSHRPYRPGLGIEAALKEIEDKRGLWFDPPVVDACLRVFREKGFAFENI